MSKAERRYITYDIHGVLSLNVSAMEVSTEILREQWQYFEVASAAADLTVHGMPSRSWDAEQHPTQADGAVFTSDDIYLRKYNLRLRHDNTKWTLSSTRETGRLAGPLIDYLLAQRGAALVHAASVAVDGSAYLVTGWGGVGKTSSLAHLVSLPGFEFMADDWTLVRADGTVLCIPKPMYIYSYHAKLYPHLFVNPPKPLIGARLSRPVAGVRHMVRPMFERFPRLEQLARKWSPEHMKVMPYAALPGARVKVRAPLGGAVFLQRGSVAQPQVRALSKLELRDRMIGVMYKEHTVSAREAFATVAGTGLVSLSDWLTDRREIIDGALAASQCIELTVPKGFQADEVGPAVAEAIRNLDGVSCAQRL